MRFAALFTLVGVAIIFGHVFPIQEGSSLDVIPVGLGWVCVAAGSVIAMAKGRSGTRWTVALWWVGIALVVVEVATQAPLLPGLVVVAVAIFVGARTYKASIPT